ncbi:P-loop NTPase family protein [Falsibacillus albus]|uniref:Uncharacterized protein n=1 Tax=Falsibacillus albus TaxID=2478915 RepID=A0A3L7JZM2_9BACI|nr:hypothetical protein [Falsibacillus albus]RLQ96223.1 hypothetical protein D9X91_08005 [Falsibacillus albus]
MNQLKLNVSLLRRKVPNLTSAAKTVGLRPATVSNLCTGKIPIERAEVRTLAALAELAKCSLDELLIKSKDGEMIETGIKIIDFFAPIVKGGNIGCVARPGMGQLVVLGEVLTRVDKKETCTIAYFQNENGPGIDDVLHAAEIICQTMDDVFQEAVSEGKKRDIFLAMDRSVIESGEYFSLQEKLEEQNIQPVTFFLADPRGEAVDENEPYGPLESLWQFDAELISRRYYPAINPIYSTSTILEGSYVDQHHMILQQKAKKLLRRYRELRFLISANTNANLSQDDKEIFERGQRLEAYFTQAFYVAEEFTKIKGTNVHLKDVLYDVQRILNGDTDHAKVDKLMYIASLPEKI